MSKLCVIISSIYEDTKTNFPLHGQGAQNTLRLNGEVETDAKTAKTLFSKTHAIEEIKVPCDISNKEKQFQYNYPKLHNKIINEQYKDCHIILNTHGGVGRHDINDSIVKNLITILSQYQVKVTQITALQCNALKINTTQDQRRQNPMTPRHHVLRDKKSSMAILQSKLNKHKTSIQQSFKITGFASSYDPEKNKKAVIELLQGKAGQSLSVTTQLVSERDLKSTINTFKESVYKKDPEAVEARKRSLEVLSLETSRMNKKLSVVDKSPKSDDELKQCLTPRTGAFLNFFQEQNQFNMRDKDGSFNYSIFRKNYRQWSKKNPFPKPRDKTSSSNEKFQENQRIKLFQDIVTATSKTNEKENIQPNKY